MKKHKTLTILIIIGTLLTVAARNHTVARRLSMGLDAGWGGEFLIIPLLLLAYFTFKADWSFE